MKKPNRDNPQQLLLAEAAAKQVVLSQTIRTQINNWGDSRANESRSSNATSRVTASQKLALESMARDNGQSVSDLISEAIEFFISYRDVAPKLVRHSDIVVPMLEKLS